MKTPGARSRASIPAIGLALLMAASTNAATITVTSTADAGGTCPGANCTLRQAITAAAAGDTLNFAAGITTVTLTSAELFINKNLTISGPGANLLTVQRSTAGGTPNFRIFNIASSVTLSGLTIANGNSGSGGAIFHTAGTVAISNATISANTATNGGGITIANTASTMTISNSTISGNMAVGGNGGGIYRAAAAGFGPLIINSSTVSGNTGGQGGGIYNAVGNQITITNSTISANNAIQGGGIYRAAVVNAMNTIIALNTVNVAVLARIFLAISRHRATT